MRRTGAKGKAAAIALAAMGALQASSDLQAATAWKGTTGDWFLASNWTAGVPTSFAQALINNGGTAQVAFGANPSPLDLGTSAGQSGSVLITAGIFTASTVNVGLAGSGTFTQTGGTYGIGATFNAGLFIGQATGGNGTYNLSGGLLTGNGSNAVLNVGYRSTGTLNQTGGTESAGSVILGGQTGGAGRYELSAGSLTSSTVTVNSAASTFNQTGGTMTVLTFTQSAGAVSFPSLSVGFNQNARTYNLTGGTLTCPTINQVGVTFNMGASALLSCTTFNLNGGTATFPTALLDSGTATLNIPTPVAVPQPTINWTGGIITPTNEYLGFNSGSYSYTHPTSGLTYQPTNLYVGFASGSTALFSMPGGSLKADTENIGFNGPGTFSQSGGTHTVTTLNIAHNNVKGTYNLSGGTLNATTVNIGGNSTFTQSGGTHNASTMSITGGYVLQSGTLQVGTFNWDSNSDFTRTGGSFNAATFNHQSGNIVAGGANSLFLEPFILGGPGIGEVGDYYPINGNLTANTISIRSGGNILFNNTSGGTFTCNTMNLEGGQLSIQEITLDSGAPAFTIRTPAGVPQPTVHLNSGTLYGSNIYLGKTPGNYTYAQATANPGVGLAGNLYVGYAAGSNATYVLSGNESLSAFVNVGNSGVGTLLQTGGTNSGGVVVKGLYNQSAGTRSGYLEVASGTYTQSGGTNTVTTETPGYLFNLGSSGPATYNLSGGSLNVTANINNEGIGASFPATFNQTGGSHTGATSMGIGSGSVYNLSGGVLSFATGGNSGTFSIVNDSATFTRFDNGGKIVLAGRSGTSSAGSLIGLTDLYLFPNSEFDAGIGGPNAGSDYGQISCVNCSIYNDVTLKVSLSNGYFPSGGQSFKIINFPAGSTPGVPFANIQLPPNWTISYNAHDITVTAVPEPACVALLALAGASIPLRRRRLRQPGRI